MKTLKKTLIGIAAAALSGTMVCTAAIAAETQPALTAPAAIEAAAEETTQTLTTKDGVLSIETAKGEATWNIAEDPNYLMAASDGKNLITVSHLANGVELPKAALADEKYEEVYQMIYSTANEVFIITGCVADKNDTEAMKDAVCSFKVLQYDTLKKEEAKSEYAIRELNETRYCTENMGVNVRSGWTTNDPVIGGFGYGAEVKVTGAVTKNGADIGWLRVDYKGQTGYTVDKYYSATKPEAQPAPAPAPTTNPEDELINGGQIFTGFEQDLYDPNTGAIVTLKELSQGGWANDQTGEIFTPEGGGGDHFYGNKGTTLVTEWYYKTYILSPEDELINGGQIFTGFEQDLYDPNTGARITLKELSQGGWANDQTGEIFTPEGGGGDHFYGNKGTTLVTEWYYMTYIAG